MNGFDERMSFQTAVFSCDKNSIEIGIFWVGFLDIKKIRTTIASPDHHAMLLATVALSSLSLIK